MRAALIGGMMLALASGAAARGQELRLVAEPEMPGPTLPPVGRSLFDELFDGAPPLPFERLLAELEARIAPARATAVLIPLGRSLQRLAADPDFFHAPRIVVAVTEDDPGPGRALLKDRIYLGYHERAEVIEVISYNEAAGRFEFQVVDGYGPGGVPDVGPADRSLCTTCHQGHGPIFPLAPWLETDANPAVAARLAALGATFHGVPTRGGVDRADAFDRSTERAARIGFLNALWNEGCGGESETEAATCRGALLLAALRFRLGGMRATEAVADTALAQRLAARLAEIAPGGLGLPSPDLPNRDPLRAILAGVSGYDAVEPDGVLDPNVPRAARALWRPEEPPAALLSQVTRDLAEGLADGDVLWLDRRLVALAGMDAPASASARLGCGGVVVEQGPGKRELRLSCPPTPGGASLAGHIELVGGRVVGGLVRTLALDDGQPVARLVVAAGSESPTDAGAMLELDLREAGLGLSARLAGGERLRPVRVMLDADGGGEAELFAVDDLAPLRTAIERMREVALADPGAALAAGPFRRRAVLAELDAALAAAEGDAEP
jgi:hypothetical protein